MGAKHGSSRPGEVVQHTEHGMEQKTQAALSRHEVDLFHSFWRLKSFKIENFSVQSACKVCSISIKIRKWSVMICPNLQTCGPADHFWGMQLLMSSLWQAFSILNCQLLSHSWSVSVCQLPSFKPTRAARSKCISVRQAPFSFSPPDESVPCATTWDEKCAAETQWLGHTSSRKVSQISWSA